MSVHSRLPDEYSKFAKSTGHSIDFRGRSWVQQSSNATKDKLQSPKPRRNSRLSDKSEVLGPFTQPYIDLRNEPRQQTYDEYAVQLTSSESIRKQQVSSKANTEIEIVRHMKNLPSYLHPVEKPKNVQDRALNVGVLDWKQLEKWKGNKQMPRKGESRASSRVHSLTMASEMPAPSKIPLQNKHCSVALHVKSPPEETMHNCAQHSQEKVKHAKDYQYNALHNVDGQQTEHSRKLKFSNGRLEIKNDKGKSTGENQKMKMQKGCLSQSSVEDRFGLPSVPTSHLLQEKRTRHNNSTKLCPKYSADEPQEIVLLVPKVYKRISSNNHQLVESRRSHDGKVVGKYQNQHSCQNSTQELLQSGEYPDEIPHSCPLPTNVSSGQGLPSDVHASVGQNDMLRSSDADISNVHYSVSFETDEVTGIGPAEKPAVKSRPQFPSHRFSFNLGKLSRSFSFRESSTVSKESSRFVGAKSGHISSEVLSGNVDPIREKVHTSSIGWSGSFRKILDPVLKPKGAHSAQAGQSNIVAPEPTTINKLVKDERHQASTFQALVQLTFKDQLPFFKFVADNSSDILAAAVKDLSMPEKKDCTFSYSFYSVSENKKKASSWMNHGSKEKSCGFCHTVVGQMKVSASRPSDIVKEYVLYGIHAGEGDKGTPEVLLNREIAAVIVKDTSNPFSHVDSNKQGETEYNDSMVVILPGAIHSLPNEGVPSSLINRWKSGGECDCGGWDMGCKMRVLIDQKEQNNSLTLSNVCSLIDRVDISNQDSEGKKQAVFCLAPFKDGCYSVNFNASVTHLEAFAICVAVLTSQRLSDILDANLLPGRNVTAEVIPAVKDNNPKVFHGQVPAKYLSSPPPSPVGRI